MTLPKGQLLDTDSSLVPGGGHVLIIPVRRRICPHAFEITR